MNALPSLRASVAAACIVWWQLLLLLLLPGADDSGHTSSSPQRSPKQQEQQQESDDKDEPSSSSEAAQQLALDDFIEARMGGSSKSQDSRKAASFQVEILAAADSRDRIERVQLGPADQRICLRHVFCAGCHSPAA